MNKFKEKNKNPQNYKVGVLFRDSKKKSDF